MKLRSLFFAFAMPLFFWCGPASRAHAEIDRERLVQMGASVLKIEVRRPQGGYGLGSGVAVGADRIVTNCHVTLGSAEVWVLRGGVRWPARAQAVDAEHDLCVLQVPGMRAQPVHLGRAANLKPGQSLTAVGFTGGLGIQSSGGNVVALHPHDGAPVIQSSNWFTSGASGGGLFDDQLRLVGVLTFRLRGGALHYFSAPVEWLQPLLQDGSRFEPLQAADGSSNGPNSSNSSSVPSASRAAAYWQRQPERQPLFLRAAALQNDARWQDLQLLAQSWGQDEASNPAPWLLQAQASAELGHLPAAVLALERAVLLAPDLAQAWLQLGLLLQRKGDVQRLPEVRESLRRLAPQLLQELDTKADTSAGRS